MKFVKPILAAVGMIFLLASCSFSPKSEREIMSEIYSDTMAYEFSYGSRGNIDYCQDGDLVVSSLTDDYPFDTSGWEWANNNFPKLEKRTWENFLQVSSEQVPFPSDLDFKCEYTSLDLKQNPPDWS